MSVELITYGSDRRLELGAAEAVRKMVYGASWNTIRIGLQLGWNDVASSITSSPQLRFGVCNGSSNVLAAATANHVVGVIPSASSYTYAAGPPATFSMSNTSQAFKKVGTTFTNVSFSAGNIFMTANSTVRTGFWLEIVKGSPNYTVRRALPSSAAAAQTDLSDAAFLAGMEATNFTDISTATGISHSILSITTLPVDEGVDGILDHLFVYWERTTHKFSFNIRHRMVA